MNITKNDLICYVKVKEYITKKTQDYQEEQYIIN